MLIDDFSDKALVSRLTTRWRAVSDQVMGGLSEPSISHAIIDGHTCMRMIGNVRLENGGGFIQASLDLAPSGQTFDASNFGGVRLMVRGNAEQYSVHLRTSDNVRPWQSYRIHFTAERKWETIQLPFKKFLPHRLDTPLATGRLRRAGLVAIGRPFQADLAVSELAFYT